MALRPLLALLVGACSVSPLGSRRPLRPALALATHGLLGAAYIYG